MTSSSYQKLRKLKETTTEEILIADFFLKMADKNEETSDAKKNEILKDFFKRMKELYQVKR